MNEQATQRPARPRPVFRTATVTRVKWLTPHMARVTFGGDELAGLTPHGPAEHIKLFLPRPGQERPVMPEWGPNGPVVAEGQERPLSRTYTPRRWDETARELDVDILVHGEGPGSSWATEAKPGDIAVITGPGGPYRLDPEAERFLVAGDESALPAIGTILEALPDGAMAQVFIEIANRDEEIGLSSAADIDLTWLHRGSEPEIGRPLAMALAGAAIDAGTRIWVGCEAGIMREVRRQLLFERGIERAAMHSHGYWKLGEANHPDHDLGQEI
jgi:NADPH-dependent ferric siderophore reductase